MTDILEIITRYRKERGWSEYQLAEQAGLPQSTISSWYKKHMTPSFASLEKICEGFGVTMSQLFAGDAEMIALTQQQRNMLNKWNRLSGEQKEPLLRFMDAMQK